MTTTLKQAKRLKALGFNLPTAYYYRKRPGMKWIIHLTDVGQKDFNSNPYAAEKYPRISAPSVADALQWIAEIKEIKWQIDSSPVLGDVMSYFDMNRNKFFIGLCNSPHDSEAESTLLDEILKHLKNTSK
jgi:hypothetical protein